MKNETTQTPWSENLIIADADYIDQVAFNLIVNFERMIGRHIPQADLARWVDCIALDGGLREGENRTQVVLLHDRDSKALDNFVPADYEQELRGKAFRDHLGEFVIDALPVEAMVSKDDMLIDILQTACAQQEVRRVMLIPNVESAGVYDDVRQALRYVDDSKRVTVFAMQPMEGGNFRQEILGYSLMNALGIRGEEIEGNS
ncbi:DUF6621 family protein [Hoylesella enoeca]|uniref:L-selectin n=1 Tax=Hoylesella enoeca TaxID=76123 RepID=A0A0S2KLY8_9BACT|nr:DUF6621 family protein [Hoylesella enoeca]ALO49322.1 hypothetical protein AS203_09665 [Hoylesella enoeca]